jgi:methylthioribulose-1-phosphate dehydratase
VLKLRGYELLKAFPGIQTHDSELAVPIFTNDQDLSRLQRAVDGYLDADPGRPCFGYIIRAHGLYTWGRDMAAARYHLEALEYLLGCERALWAAHLGH